MKIEGTIYCEGPECGVHQHVGIPNMNAGRLPVGWIRLTEYGDTGPLETAYHGWDCVLKAAAHLPPAEIVPFGPEDSDA
jgi:hypothetical protein